MSDPPLTISPVTMRRFVLGKQGLWPGRRWRGKPGAAQAIYDMGAVQIDPLLVIARNHDLELHSRVADYTPAHLHQLLYVDRRFFDYGGTLHVYPMEELRYWQLHMQRHKTEAWWQEFMASEGNRALVEQVRAEIRTRGPLGHRDMEGTARVESYRARKDAGLAMYLLWRVGELMTAGRRGFDRLYDFAENVAPAQHRVAAGEAETEAFFLRKALLMDGLARLVEWRNWFAYFIRRPVAQDEMKRLVADLIASGQVTAVKVEGKKDLYYLSSADLPLLETVQRGDVPPAWTPLDSTTENEVNFLSPLDPVSARGRAAKLFDFEYKWEIYTPVEKRKWGYYVLPILYGDSLVGRIDLKLDRPNKTLLVKGFWLEDDLTAKDPLFATALARGLARLTLFHDVTRLDANTIRPAGLRAAKLFKDSGVTLVRA